MDEGAAMKDGRAQTPASRQLDIFAAKAAEI
jgi:hypothetical protein